MFRRRMLLDPKPVEGGGNNPPPTPTPAPEPETKGPDLAKAVEALVARHGDGTAALRVLLSENHAYRDQLRDLRGKLPAEGSRVLTADEARALEAYAALGKPEDLRRVKAEHGQFSGELAGLKRDDELRGVSEKAGVKFSVLKTLAGKLDFTQTVKVTDPKTKAVTEALAVKDGEAEPVAFEEFAARHWADFLPALKATGKAEPEARGVPPRRNAAPLPPVAGATPAPTGIKPVRF